MNLDLADPVTDRFIASLLTLTPSAWDAIDARMTAILDALPSAPPPKIGLGARLLTPLLVPVIYAVAWVDPYAPFDPEIPWVALLPPLLAPST